MAMLLFQGPNGEESFRLFKNITRIGASSEADICLNLEDVADDHAHITRDGDNFVISSNGRGRAVKVNGKKEKRVVLRSGDVVELGQAHLRFVAHDVANSPNAQSAANDGSTDQSSLEAYRRIVGFSDKLLRAKELNVLLTTLMDSVIELSQADKGFLVLFENGEPQVRVARNINQENLDDAVSQLSDSIIAKVVREQQPVIVSDALHDREFKSSVSVMNLNLQSVLCAPLTEDGELLGLIYLGSDKLANLFDGASLEPITVFAAQASLLIRNAILLDRLRADNTELRQAVKEQRFGKMIGSSEGMQEVFRKVSKVAPTDISVLITGETGTGKELIAREVHRRSDRADKPLVVVNCGAIPDNLLESELFGHVRGAFTGAVTTREGRFQAADGGTLFLDEIGEMPVGLQVKILRALQERSVTKIGTTTHESVDIRILSATNRNLEEDIKAGSFREDLYYRLHVVGIHLPPLRERGEDIMMIARYLLRQLADQYNPKVKDFSPQSAMLMKQFAWPGNIRQLENRIKKAVIMTDHGHLTPEDLELTDRDLEPLIPLAQAKEEFQRQYIDEALARNDGNRTKTALDLGVDPRTIFRHLERKDPLDT